MSKEREPMSQVDSVLKSHAEAIEQHTIVDEVKFEQKSGFGFGNPDGNGVESRLCSGDLQPETLTMATNFVLHNPEAFKVIEENDPACMDGRSTEKIYKKENDQLVEFNKSKLRPKVVGGGQITVMAGQIAVGTVEASISAQLELAAGFLENNNLPHGAHTGQAENASDSGCGAIDRLPAIITTISMYPDFIKSILKIMMDEKYNGLKVEEVFDNYKKALGTIDPETYKGASVFKKIENSGLVVKALGGKHNEIMIVINCIKNTTLDQAALNELTNNEAQAFSIDEWKFRELAKKIADGNNDEELKAYIGMFVYAIATSAVLTAGDQNVYVRKALEEN